MLEYSAADVCVRVKFPAILCWCRSVGTRQTREVGVDERTKRAAKRCAIDAVALFIANGVVILLGVRVNGDMTRVIAPTRRQLEWSEFCHCWSRGLSSISV